MSQTQEKNDTVSVFDGSDIEDGTVTSVTEGTGQDPINTHLNTVFDDTDDFLSCELTSMLNHRYFTGALEFKLEYDNGDIS